MLQPTPIERRKLFELVAERIGEMIISGALRPGDQLPPERELQALFGVGRPAVREALIALERAGFVSIGNGAPARVAHPSTASIVASMVPSIRFLLSTAEGNRQFQAIRLLVEVGLVRDAARRATPEFLEELGAALAENRASLGDTQRFIASDVRFHFVIARFAGEDAIVAIHEAMVAWLSTQRAVVLREPAAAERATAAHARIFEAIAAKSADAAEEAMRAHLAEVRADYWTNVARG